MSRDTSSDLNVELHHLLHRETPNYRSFTTENKLDITLYYLKDTGSLWMTESFFGIRQCTTSKTMRTVFEAIKSVLGQKYLHLPRTTTEMQKKKVSEFEVKFGMIQAFECIDGTCIPLKILLVNSQDFLIISSTFRTYRLFVIVLSRLFMIGKVTLWTWNVSG